MKIETSGIILTAANADITICEVFGDLPTGLIPVNGKPIIFFILQQFFENGIKDVYIGVDYKQNKLKEVVDLYFGNKLNIKYVLTGKSKGPGNSLLTIFKEVKTSKVIINLGDTYIKNLSLNELTDSIVVSNDFLDEQRWATVEVENKEKIKKFCNKEKIVSDKLYAICGLYALSDIFIFNDFLADSDSIQIVELLEYYRNISNKLTINITKEWLDFGHIDKYYISKKRLIQSRGFNSLEYDDFLGTITKRSKNVEKFRTEIQWQIDLPKNIQVLAPRILDYSIGEKPFITMEFFSYPTLSEIWLFSELNGKVYFSIIDKLFKILELFKKNKKDVSIDDYRTMYIDKTIQRVTEINNQDILYLLQHETININGKRYENWSQIKKVVIPLANNLYNEEDNCFIHGDFCLSNILYDLRSGIARLIDPRGVFGSSKNGDIKYDVAKLRHSICGDYDYIANDLFSVNVSSDSIKYSIFSSNKLEVKEYFDNFLSKTYDLNQIKFIEGLLFLSMISLHEDNYNRQLVMYAKSIELLSESLKGY